VISCLIRKYTKQELKLILIDPKLVEFDEYADAPQVIKISNSSANVDIHPTLTSLYEEVISRYDLFKNKRVKSIQEYNAMAGTKLPYVVTVIDEFADLFFDEDITNALVRVTQISRAAGVHFIIATQRPSADIINGKIKANFPARIAFKVPSPQDSIIILGSSDADKLAVAGSFLYTLSGVSGIKRAQAIWTTPEYTRSMVATLANDEYRNLQRPIDASTCVNIESFDERNYDDAYGGAYTHGDFNMCMIHVFNNDLDSVTLSDLKYIITSTYARECVIREFNRLGIVWEIDDKMVVNKLALKRSIQQSLQLDYK
jgi:hypothetical protein